MSALDKVLAAAAGRDPAKALEHLHVAAAYSGLDPDAFVGMAWVELTAAGPGPFDFPASVALSGDPKKPYGDVHYADPGYQADKKKRYPLDTDDHINAALGYINQEDNASKYSSADLAKVKAAIYSAAKKAGIKTEGDGK